MSESKSTGQRSIVYNRFKAHFLGKHADIKTAANALKLSLEVTEKALDALPVYGPKAAIGAVLRIIEQYEKCTDNTELLRGIESHLNRLRTAVIDPLAQPNTAISPELEAAVDILVRYLDSATSGWDTKLSQGFLKRFLNAKEYEAGLIALAHDIDDALSCFQSNDKDARERDERLQESIDEVAESVWAATGDAIKAMPHAIRASYDSAAHNEIRPCLPGTRVAVLRKIRTFIRNMQENQMKNYLLSGMAGLGKSTIARSVCEEVRDQQYADLAASFFFSRRAADSRLRNPLIVIPTLAYQLAHYDEGFRTALKEELARDPELPTKAAQFQADGLLAKPLSNMSPRQHPILIVLDAFDECDREHIAEEVLHCILVSIAAAPCNIKLLITSRPEAHIRAVFMKSRTHDSLILHEIEEDVVKGDIWLYLQTSLRAIPSTLGLNLPNDWATQGETEALVENAGKLFIYAATAVRLLSDRRVCDPQSLLQKLLKANTGAASGLHARLDKTYVTILRAAVPPPPEQAAVVGRIRQVLGTLIHLQDTLPMGAIDGLLMKDSGYSRRSLNSLHSVVLVPESDNGFPRLYHQSFPDFLLDPQRCSDVRFLIKAEDHHTNLSLHCLKLLNQYLRRDMAGIEDLLLPHSEIEEFDRKVAIVVPPHLAYACRFWAEHLASSHQGGPDLLQLLLIFVFKNVLHWVECMSLLGSMELAIRSIQMALQWAEELKAPAGAIAMLRDTARFLQAYSEPIGSCAIHVYRTALTFAPSETILFNNFKYEAKRSHLIRGGAETWPASIAVWNMAAAVICVAFAPNGAQLAITYNSAGAFHGCDAFTGEITAVFRGHSDMVCSVMFSPDSTRIASGSRDQTVRLWDAQSGKQLAVLGGQSGMVSSVAFSPDGTRIVSGSHDKTIRVWDAQSGKQLAVLGDHSAIVCSVIFSPDGTQIASGLGDKTVRLWNARSGKQVAVLDGHSSWVYSVAFSPDSTQIASGSYDKTVRVWSAQSGMQLAVLDGQSDIVSSVAFSPNGTRIASGSDDQTVRVWDAPSGKQLRALTGHSGSVSSVTFSPNGTRIASGSEDKTIRMWDAQLGQQLMALDDHSATVSSVTFSPNGTLIASTSDDQTVRVWDAQSGKQLAVLNSHPSSAFSVAFSPDGTQIAFISDNRTIRVWDVQSGKQLAVLNSRPGSVSSWAVSRPSSGSSLAFSPDNTRIACLSDGETVQVWDIQSGKQLAILFHSSSAFLLDDTQIVSGSPARTVWVANAQSGEQLVDLDSDLSSIFVLEWNGASTTVSGEEVQKFFNPSTGILQQATGSTPLATFADTLIYNRSTRWIVEQSSRRHILFIPRTYNIKSGVAFSPIGGLAAFGTKDGMVVIVRL